MFTLLANLQSAGQATSNLPQRFHLLSLNTLLFQRQLRQVNGYRCSNQELHHYSGIATENTVEIMEVNQSCQVLANAKDNIPKAKHIELRYHFSRKAISNGEIKLQYSPTKEMHADMLTKPLERIQFQVNHKRLNLY
jgi:hypothetical protein